MGQGYCPLLPPRPRHEKLVYGRDSRSLPQLGLGYRLVRDAAEGAGPSIEVGWLSQAQQLQSLKFTFAEGAPADAVTDMTGRLVEMAKTMDTTDGEAAAK